MFSVPLSFRFKFGTHLGLWQYWTYYVYTAQRVRSVLTCTLRADSGLRAKPRPLRTCSRFRIVQDFVIRGVLKGVINVPENMLCSEMLPAGTVLAGTQLFRTRSDYKKWCVPRTSPREHCCHSWNCTENKWWICHWYSIYMYLSVYCQNYSTYPFLYGVYNLYVFNSCLHIAIKDVIRIFHFFDIHQNYLVALKAMYKGNV